MKTKYNTSKQRPPKTTTKQETNKQKTYYLLYYNNGTKTHSTGRYKTRGATVHNNFVL